MNDFTCATNTISENKNVHVNVFPNPTTDVLYIGDGNTMYDQIITSDVQGKEIMNENNTSNISTASLRNGMYFLKAVKGNQMVSSSFVKE